jgi:hypothetical protein
MTVEVIDAESEEPVSTRCCVIDANGVKRYPYRHHSLYHSHGDGYFYCDGDFTLSVPTGPTVVRIARGPEYYPSLDTLTIHGDTTVTVTLARMIDMRHEGWYSGDVHVHINHEGGLYYLDAGHAHWMGTAEDLHFVNCLDNGYLFTGAPDPVSTSDCTVYMSEELRSNVYGHCSLPGLKSLIEPTSTSWETLLMDVADSVHAQSGPLIISAHPISTYDFDHIEDWPGSGLARELPIDVIYGKFDALEVLCYSNVDEGVELDLWYHLLNCGFRMPPAAGTDAAVNRQEDGPMGGFRSYVEYDTGAPDIYQWLGGLAAGRSFITNGPLFTDFTAAGSMGAGDSLVVYGGSYEVELEVSACCAFPLDGIEIVVNGEVVDEILPSGDPRSISGMSSFTVSESCWIAARAHGPAGEWVTIGSELLAHTGPFYLVLFGERILKEESAEYFVEWIDSLIALAEEKGIWNSPADSIRAFDEFTAARNWYAGLISTTSVEGDYLADAVPAAPLLTAHPNPFSNSTEIRIEPPPAKGTSYAALPQKGAAGRAVLIIYDVSGRVVRRLETAADPASVRSVVWDGRNDAGNAVASGIYFCRTAGSYPESSLKMLLIR